MKYIKVEWPEIQDYMNNPEEECYFDRDKNCWFIPEDWEPGYSGSDSNIGDIEDAMG